MNKPTISLLLCLLMLSIKMFGTTFYSQGSCAPEVIASWNESRAGGGNTPLNFTSGDVFVVQGGHSMTTGANWSISGTGSVLWIENGGILTATFPVTLAKATTFKIDDGGTFIHNNTGAPSSTIFNGTESFSANSTFWIKNWIGNLYVIPSGITWGNLIIDVPALSGSWNQVGNVATVKGILDIRQTGGSENEFRLCSRSNSSCTLNLANIHVSGGILSIQGGGTTGAPDIHTIVIGDILVTGGKFDLGTNGYSNISLSGNLTISDQGIVMNSGAASKIIFSKTGTQSVNLTTDAMSSTLINVDIIAGCTVEMNSCWVMSSLSTMNVYGTLNTNNYTLKPRALNVGGVLNLGNGVLDQIGTAAIIIGGPSLGYSGTINCQGIINMAPSSFASFLIQPGGVLNLDSGTVNMNHTMATFFIDTGGTLNCGSGRVASINSTLSTFILNPGGTLVTGSPDGITLTGETGSIQVGGSRNYHYAANYSYHGTTAQVTGNGLPGTVNDLTINNAVGITLCNDVMVSSTLNLIAGVIVPSGKTVSYGESGILAYSGMSYPLTTSVEFPLVNGPKSLMINNSSPAGIELHATRKLTGSLTIASPAKFIIPEGTCLAVNGSTVLNGPDCLQIRPDGSYIDNGDAYTGTGNAIVERTVTAGAWHYISSPVQSAQASVFLGDYIKPYAEGTSGFGPNIVSPLEPLNMSEGYALWPTTNHTVRFCGNQLNTGSLEKKVTRTYTGQTGTDEYDGWNLVGNPYPCTIDLDIAHNDWENVEATAYFWDQSFSSGGNYSVYPAMNGFGTHSQYVPAMQGFFVHCNAAATHEVPGSGIVRFNNASKVSSPEIFLRRAKQLLNTLFIKVTGSENDYYDQLVVHFDPNTTGGFDPGYDAHKLWGLEEAPQIYTITSDMLKATINVLPFDTSGTTIPMGFKSGIPGTYYMVFDSIFSFGEGISVILEDLGIHKSIDLKEHPEYDFLYAEGDIPDRFLLHFNNHKLGVNSSEKPQPLRIYIHAGQVIIENSCVQNLTGDVFMYDMTGREMFRSPLVNEQINRINHNFDAGCYILRIVSNLGTFNKKVCLF